MMIGYRFLPTDQELVSHFLKNKITGQPVNDIIERDMYGTDSTPWILFKEDDPDIPWQMVASSLGKVIQSERVLYLFTKLSNVGKSTGSKKIKRAAGCGNWHNTSGLEAIRDEMGIQIGSKRTFIFKSDEESLDHWTMYEYTIDPVANGIEGMNTSTVLCKVKKNVSKTSEGGRIVSKMVSGKRFRTLAMPDEEDESDSNEGSNSITEILCPEPISSVPGINIFSGPSGTSGDDTTDDA